MCRMIGIASGVKMSPLWFEEFQKLSVSGRIKREMTEGHGDGWGIAGYLGNWTVHFGRSAGSAAKEAKAYEKAAGLAVNSNSKIVLAHLRKASEGAVNLENSHPFVLGEWVFCHNGTIYDSDRIMLSRFKYSGSTDSERFFKFLVSRLEIGRMDDYAEILMCALKELKQTCRYTSLNFLMSNGKCLMAYRDYSEEEDYYTLYKASSGSGSFLACSEPVAGFEWSPFSNGELIITGRDGAKVCRGERGGWIAAAC